MPDPLDLSASSDLVWQRLDAAARAKAPLGLKSLTLASVGPDGAPRARTIILRSVDAAARTIAFHADRTSAKIAELRRDPRATFVGWDADARLQLRLTATIAIHLDDATADAFWASTSGLDVYRNALPSGATIPSPTEAMRVEVPQRDRFAMLVASVSSIEWLSLGEPQRRGIWRFGVADRHEYLVP